MAWIFQSETSTSGSYNSATPSLTASFNIATPDPRRKAFFVYNNSSVDFYFKCGVSASLTDFSVKVPANFLYEFPIPVFTGLMTAIYSVTGSGLTMVTDFS